MVYRETKMMAERKQSRRQRFLAEAARLFGEKGFHETTVPMIVAAAGSSTGAFYLYFRNKEDIFAAALEVIDERINRAIAEAADAAGDDVVWHMRAAVEALAGFLTENPRDARILLVESSGLGKRLEEVRRRIVQGHVRGVEQALAAIARRLPPMDIAVAARCWVGAVYEAVFHWLEQPPRKRISPEALADAIAAYNLRAIGAPAEKRPPGGKRK